MTTRANAVTPVSRLPVSRLSRWVTGGAAISRENDGMRKPDVSQHRAKLEHLVATGRHAEVDALLLEMHTTFHDRPGDHVRVHLAWMRVQFQRGAYLRALGHAFAGLVVAGPASLVQRYTGLVVPAFDAERRS